MRRDAALCLVGAVLLSAVAGWGSPGWWALPLLAAGVAGTERAVVQLQVGRRRWCLSLTEAALAAALVVSEGAWVVAALAIGAGSAQALRRMPRLKLQFNVAQYAAAAACAAVTSSLLGGGLPGAVAGLGAYWLVNDLLVARVVSLTSRQGFLSLVRARAPLSALHTAGNASIGLLAAHLALTAPLELPGLLVPLALLWACYDQQSRRSAEVRLFEELARGQEQAAGRSTDSSAEVVLTAAARLFGGADVEMVLLAADGPVRYTGDENGVPRRSRVDPDAFDEPWVVRALGLHGVATGTTDGRPWCSAVLGPVEQPLAVLLAQRPRGSAAFGRTEERLAEVLVAQAERWLSAAALAERSAQAADRAGQAARALGDIGADTAPALVLLRESADRLARLASDAGGIGSIVEELQVVERAVASLLGAVALAAEPDLLRPAVGLPEAPVRTAEDWTSTGVLP